MAPSNNRRKSKYYIFGSFLACCLGASLQISAMATQYWFQADLRSTISDDAKGSINFGLFEGYKIKELVVNSKHKLKVVCGDGDCMFSCGVTKDERKEQLKYLQTDSSIDWNVWTANHCKEPSTFLSPGEVWRVREYDEAANETSTPEPTPNDAEFLDYGLWAGTIACLVLGMVFAVVGALFAVVNTATTPVEAITGVPGLYVWNGLAALFNLACVIVWAVQFHVHLTNNVLVVDQQNGWTTKDQEVFGYSFWLVVVAIFVHVANILIIFFGTYEPRVKETMKAPEAKSGTIMLY